MTILAKPIAGIKEATSNDHAMCGRLAAQSILAVLGHNVEVPAPDEANAAQIKAAIDGLRLPGIQTAIVEGDGATVVNSGVALGRYAVLGVNCTSYAVPTSQITGIRHWVAAYSNEGNEYNCWEATYEDINFSACHNSEMGTVVVWNDAPAEPGTPTSFNCRVSVPLANVRSGPGTNYPTLKSTGGHPCPLRRGFELGIVRYVEAQDVAGNHRWYKINTEGWISGAVVDIQAPGSHS